jgi:hypothetical protein
MGIDMSPEMVGLIGFLYGCNRLPGSTGSLWLAGLVNTIGDGPIRVCGQFYLLCSTSFYAHGGTGMGFGSDGRGLQFCLQSPWKITRWFGHEHHRGKRYFCCLYGLQFGERRYLHKSVLAPDEGERL